MRAGSILQLYRRVSISRSFLRAHYLHPLYLGNLGDLRKSRAVVSGAYFAARLFHIETRPQLGRLHRHTLKLKRSLNPDAPDSVSGVFRDCGETFRDAADLLIDLMRPANSFGGFSGVGIPTGVP